MFHSITSHVTNPAVYKKLGYDTINDFTPITQIAWVPLVIVVHPSFPAKNVRELIAIAKAQPGQVNYASFGQGSMSHLAGELLKMMAKIDIVHIPYKGGGPALIDALAGHVPVYFSSIAPSLPNIKAGRLRALALTGTERSKQLPDVPTVAETPGLKGYDATIMYAIWAPAKTPPRDRQPPARRDRESAATRRSSRSASTSKARASRSATRPEQMAATIQSDMKKLAKLVQVSGLQPQ